MGTSIALLLVASLAGNLIAGIIKMYYSDKTCGELTGVLTFNSITSLATAVTLVLWGGIGEMSLYTLIMGAAFGILTAVQALTYLAAMQIGSKAYTTVIIVCSCILPTVSGALFFNEQLQWAHIVGIALMMACFFLSVEKDTEKKKVSFRWLALCMVAFLCTGGIGLMQKVHQSSAYKGELNEFLVISFVVSCLFSIVYILVRQRGKKESLFPKMEKSQLWILPVILVLCGAAVAVNNKLNLYLSGAMESAVFFPIVNGGSLVLSLLAALLIFHERLSKKQWIGVVVGVVAVLFLCNPFG